MASIPPIPTTLFHMVSLIAIMEQTENHGKKAKLRKDALHIRLGASDVLMQMLSGSEVLSYNGFMTDIGLELAQFRTAAYQLCLAVNKVGCLIEKVDVPRPWTNPSMDAD